MLLLRSSYCNDSGSGNVPDILGCRIDDGKDLKYRNVLWTPGTKDFTPWHSDHCTRRYDQECYLFRRSGGQLSKLSSIFTIKKSSGAGY